MRTPLRPASTPVAAILFALMFAQPTLPAGAAVPGTTTARTCQLDNRYLSRTISVAEGWLTTVQLQNKLANKRLTPTGGDEFRLRLSHGVDAAEPDTC
jgi:hypothetical protein